LLFNEKIRYPDTFDAQRALFMHLVYEKLDVEGFLERGARMMERTMKELEERK
jgi:hypothetical protein